MMNWKDDLRYPFGNPVRDRLCDKQTRVAIHNVLLLAQDKIRIAKGEGEEILMDDADYIIAEQSIQTLTNLIDYADGKKEAETNKT